MSKESRNLLRKERNDRIDSNTISTPDVVESQSYVKEKSISKIFTTIITVTSIASILAGSLIGGGQLGEWFKNLFKNDKPIGGDSENQNTDEMKLDYVENISLDITSEESIKEVVKYLIDNGYYTQKYVDSIVAQYKGSKVNVEDYLTRMLKYLNGTLTKADYGVSLDDESKDEMIKKETQRFAIALYGDETNKGLVANVDGFANSKKTILGEKVETLYIPSGKLLSSLTILDKNSEGYEYAKQIAVLLDEEAKDIEDDWTTKTTKDGDTTYAIDSNHTDNFEERAESYYKLCKEIIKNKKLDMHAKVILLQDLKSKYDLFQPALTKTQREYLSQEFENISIEMVWSNTLNDMGIINDVKGNCGKDSVEKEEYNKEDAKNANNSYGAGNATKKEEKGGKDLGTVTEKKKPSKPAREETTTKVHTENVTEGHTTVTDPDTGKKVDVEVTTNKNGEGHGETKVPGGQVVEEKTTVDNKQEIISEETVMPGEEETPVTYSDADASKAKAATGLEASGVSGLGLAAVRILRRKF